MRAPLVALAGLAALALSLPSPAAEPAAPATGLGLALEQAWRLHPDAAALDARDAEAQAARELADKPTPEPGSIAVGSRNDRFDRNLGQQEYEIELATPLWLPGQQAARAAAAAGRGSEVVARRAALRLELAADLRESWWQLAAARNARALATRRLETARALARDVDRRYRAGELSRIDANLAQTEVHAADAELLEAEATLLQAEQALRTLTGTAPPQLLDEETLSPRAVAGIEAASADHPQLVAAAAAATSARAAAKLAAASRRAAPELALRVVRERGSFAEPYANSLGIRLKIPFASDAQVRRDGSAAQAEAERADAEMQRARARVALAAERAQRAVPAAERQLSMARDRRDLSAENLRLAEKAFALGESDLATLLRIRAAAFDADALLDRQRVARAAALARLNQALGVLP